MSEHGLQRVNRIILAEDSEELADLMENALREDGHEVIRVEDGYELSDYLDLSGTPQSRKLLPDLLVTDLRMPGKSGLDALVTARNAGLQFPTLLVTAFPDEEVEARAMALGATVMAKPMDLDQLRKTVMTILGMS